MSMNKLVISTEAFAPDLANILSSGGHVFLVVSGSSMKPFLKHRRDMVCLRACKKEDFKCGQILLYKRPDQSLVLHRIRKVLSDGELIMNGDAQAWCETISSNQVIAVVSSVDRKGRYISCDCAWFRLWNLFWYPTSLLRPALFRAWHILFAERRAS
jgi:hypothetical protein